MVRERYFKHTFIVCLVLIAQLVAQLVPDSSAVAPELVDSTDGQPAFARLPLQFEANEGQADDIVKFLARGQGYNVFLTSNETMQVVSNPAAGHASALLRMQLVGGATDPQAKGMDLLLSSSGAELRLRKPAIYQ